MGTPTITGVGQLREIRFFYKLLIMNDFIRFLFLFYYLLEMLLLLSMVFYFYIELL